MAIGPRKLKAYTLQTGARGGTFYMTETGQKVYAHEAPKGGDAPSPMAALVRAKQVGPVERRAEAAAPKPSAKASVFEAAKTSPKPPHEVGGKMRPSAGAGAQLEPHVLDRLRALGVSKLPAAHIAHIEVSKHLHDDAHAPKGALIKWKDDKGRTQSAYSKQHDEEQAKKKWDRVLKNAPKVEAALADMRAKAQTSPAHAAAVVMQSTGLRPGSNKSVKEEGHYGITTLEGRHVRFEGGKAHLEFIGKQGKLNTATISDPQVVSALRKHAEGKGPKDRIFAGAAVSDIRAAAPKGVKLKDLRTIAATTHATQELDKLGAPKLTGNTRQDARAVASILKGVSESVSKRLNNTPAMARKSYIAPQVIKAWAAKHGIGEDIIKWP